MLKVGEVLVKLAEGWRRCQGAGARPALSWEPLIPFVVGLSNHAFWGGSGVPCT